MSGYMLAWVSGASVAADGMGYAATDVEFFALTGLGDGAGVLVGHTAFYALKVGGAGGLACVRC